MAFSSDWQNRRIAQGLIQAATGKFNLAALGMGAVGAASLHSWAVLALGGAAYLALAAWDLTSKSFWTRVVEGTLQRESLPALRDVKDVEVRASVERIQAARKAIDRALAEAPEEVSLQVRASLGGLEELDARAARLVDLAEGLARHLAGVDEPALRAEAQNLAAKSNSATDTESQALYREASDARQEQLRALLDVRRARERLLANLARIVSNLEGVPTRVVRMRVLDAASESGSSDDIGWEIGRINGELAALEQTLEVLVGERTV
ncbi:MAG TPA: hypothetical protein VGJ91_07020 [Polyangiaceae bacterium]